MLGPGELVSTCDKQELKVVPGNQAIFTHRMENTKGHSKVADLLGAAGVPVA